MGKFVDLTGRRFGRLTVTKRVAIDAKYRSRWECKCDCGNVKVVYAYNLANGHTASCGCLTRESLHAIASTHCMSGSRLYRIWCNLKDRCQRENHDRYADYGGRGVSVCEEWQTFEPFYEWAMANGYRDDLSLDRRDNDGGYCPENCRWATKVEQANNTRANRMISCFGETHTLAEWGRICGIQADTIAYRIKLGWSVEKALSTPVRRRTCD